jgi:hypothetical protein
MELNFEEAEVMVEDEEIFDDSSFDVEEGEADE